MSSMSSEAAQHLRKREPGGGGQLQGPDGLSSVSLIQPSGAVLPCSQALQPQITLHRAQLFKMETSLPVY